ncbi:MAG TPA: TlyA family RNA methyltransferase [Bdellovibrionota bacterium]|nr:TlyA family RNA methyltransferase [Bdellovibrionota bacterium]
MKGPGKKRIDVLLAESGLAPSRERAQGLILSGNVLVDDVPVTKPGQLVAESAQVRIRGEEHPYVSRGGIKLAAALDAFAIRTEGRSAMDVGASTGGFTQVLLMRGVRKVFAVDVGHNQLDWSLRNDPRVVVREKVNARYLKFDDIGEKVGLIVMDVSFISIDKLLEPLLAFAEAETDWVTLIKPQFEVGREHVGKGGIVTSAEERARAIERLTLHGESLGLRRRGLVESPITGTQGNVEFLAHWQREK